MKILFIWSLFITFSFAQTSSDGMFTQLNPASSKDGAIVLLNNSDGSVVKGITKNYMRDSLKSHYKEENLVYVTKEELQKCNKVLKANKAFKCARDQEGCALPQVEGFPEIKSLTDYFTSRKAECPQIDNIEKVFNESANVDVYSATHGGDSRALTELVKNSHTPALEKKLRLFYSMGCNDAQPSESPEGLQDSDIAKDALKAGFSSFAGHVGFSFSPVVFPQFMNKLKSGKNIKDVEAEMNSSLNGFMKGTKMRTSGDPDISIKKRPSPNHSQKFCARNFGKVPLNVLRQQSCFKEEYIMEYYFKYPKLIDAEFCAVEIDNPYIRTKAYAVCAAVGLATESQIKEISMDALISLTAEEINCGDDAKVEKLFGCVNKTLEKGDNYDPDLLKNILLDSKDTLSYPKRMTILKGTKEPQDCK